MTRPNLLFIVLILLLSSCGESSVAIPRKYNELPKIEYCDLPLYENKEVILTSKYEGILEYWSLQPIDPCKLDLNVDFDTRDYYYNMPEHLKKKLNRNAKYFIVTAVGKFQRGNKEGYGHLGHLESTFIVSDLINVKAILH